MGSIWDGQFHERLLVYGLLRWCSGKESTCQCRRLKRFGFNPCVRKIRWRKKWQPTPVFLPKKFHGLRSLAGYSRWGRKESDTTERQSTHISMQFQLLLLLLSRFPSCPTLCDPIDGSPPGSPVPGILQARTLEWVVISFSNAVKWKVKVKSLSRVRLLETPWIAAEGSRISLETFAEIFSGKHRVTKSWTWLKWLSMQATCYNFCTLHSKEGAKTYVSRGKKGNKILKKLL